MNAAEVLTPLPRLIERDPTDRDHDEIIDGVRVELPPMRADSSVLAARLAHRLTTFGIEHQL